MPTLVLGNSNPQMQELELDENGAPTGRTVSVEAGHLNQTTTEVTLWDGVDDEDFVDLTLSTNNDRALANLARALPKAHRKYAVAINEIEQLLVTHAGGDAPDFVDLVDSDDSELAKAVAGYFDCHLGTPTALLTSVGRDALHKQHMDTSAQPAAFNYMAVSANVTAPSTASTTLPGEITTAGGGLLRAQATFAHTNGTNTSTLTKTFTANGSDSLPVTIGKIGVLNAASVGTLGYETLLSATATLTVSGDNVAITETVTGG